MAGAGDTWPERVAHAFVPWEWRGRNLAVLIVVVAVVAAVTTVQRFILAEGAAGYVWAVGHGIAAAVVVVLLSTRAVARWKEIHRGDAA